MTEEESENSEPSPEVLSGIYSEQINAILWEDDPAGIKPVLEPDREEKTKVLPLNMLIHRSTVGYYRQIIQEHERLDIFSQAFLVARLIAAARKEEIEELEPLVRDLTEEEIADMSKTAREEINSTIKDLQLDVALEQMTGEKVGPTPQKPTPEQWSTWMKMQSLADLGYYQQAIKERESALFHARRVQKYIPEEQQQNILSEIDAMGE